MKYFLLTLFICLTFYGKAQDSITTISGKVIDFKTKEPVSFVIVNDLQTNKTVQTDLKGEFQISYKSKASVLIISKLGYETQTVNISGTTKLPLLINLKNRVLELPEVMISDNKTTKRLVNNSFYVLDYQFLNNSILLLGETNDKNILKLIDKNGKELKKLALDSIKSETLFKDCFDNIHVLTENNSFQVYINLNGIHLLDKVRRRLFDSLLHPCILNTTENLYFENTLNKGQTKTFFVINKTTKQKSGLGIFSDEFKISMAKNEADYMRMKYGYTDENNTMGGVSADDLRASRRKSDDIEFARRVIFSSAYIPFLYNNDTITVFDHPNDLIHRYLLNNTEISLQSMEYHHYKNWKPQVISDDITHKYYTTYLHDGIIILGEINLATGKIVKRFSLKHTFPKNIKVKDGVVYYLYRLRDSGDKMALYAYSIN